MKTKDNKGKGVRVMVRGMKYALLIALLLVSIKPAYANLAEVGPNHPISGFPVYYGDGSVRLEIGLDPVLNFFDPPVVGNTYSEQIGFGAEAFYWLCEALIDLPAGNRFRYVTALEAAFATEDPVYGDQLVFTRIRFVMDAPVAGTYTITHPFGVDVFNNVEAGARTIFHTIDKGTFFPDFTGALTSRVGPLFLKAVNPAPPAGFLGDPNIEQTITGSPFGTNFVRIEGPVGSNLDGNGNNSVQTNLFSVSGKIFSGIAPTPLFVRRAEYQRAVTGNIDIFITSALDAVASFTGAGLPVTPMNGDGTGKFFGQLNLNDASNLPPTVSITTVRAPDMSATTKIQDLTDAVTITRADYDVTAGTLAIHANSSDAFAPPTLTATGYGNLTNGNVVVNNVLVPPPDVTVTSSAGGSSTKTVHVINPPSEVLTVTRAFFRTVGNAWLVSGTDSVTTTGNIITIHLGGLGGPVIGTVQSTLTGVWNIISQNSGIIPNQGDTITLESTAGALLTAIPITIIRR